MADPPCSASSLSPAAPCPRSRRKKRRPLLTLRTPPVRAHRMKLRKLHHPRRHELWGVHGMSRCGHGRRTSEAYTRVWWCRSATEGNEGPNLRRTRSLESGALQPSPAEPPTYAPACSPSRHPNGCACGCTSSMHDGVPCFQVKQSAYGTHARGLAQQELREQAVAFLRGRCCSLYVAIGLG